MDSLAHKPTPMAGALVLILGIGFAVYTVNQRDGLASEPLAGSRPEERRQARLEVEEQGNAVLGSYAVIDADNDVYQLPIERSMGLLVREWRNDAESGRASFLERARRVHGEVQETAPDGAPEDTESAPVNQFE